MTILIQQITPEQAASWRNLRLAALQECPAAFGASLNDEQALSLDDFKDRLNNNVILGAWDNNILVGCVGCAFLKSEKTAHRAIMFGMYVAPDARGKGVSKALVEAVLAKASTVADQIHCTVVTDNQAAIALYKKHGFVVYGTEPRSLKIGTQYHDEHQMILIFR